jgi:glycine/D-amino acid oxidase-like deaminating enzyme
MAAGRTADVVVCGAGIAGVSAAFHLAVRRGVERVVLVDERAPLTLTSDKSTECYRNWWPGPGDAMVRLMERSVDLLEELAAATGDAFAMNRRGYAYLTAEPARAEAWVQEAAAISRLGAGPLRVHRGRADDPGYPLSPAGEGFAGHPVGADLSLDRDSILDRFPFLTSDVVALLEPRRCGWLSAQQLGMTLLEAARERGVSLVRGRIERVVVEGGRVQAVEVDGGPDAGRIATPCVVVAAGPRVAEVGRLLGVELPVVHELHAKVTFQDHRRVVPRDLPLMIWTDPVTLPWSEGERRDLGGDPGLAGLAGPLPGGVHFRPEGGADASTLLLLWAYDTRPRRPVFPPRFDPAYPEVVLRGLARMVPGFAAYLDEPLRDVYVDGGYYTKTRENRPLVGPLPIQGSYVIGALSGFGIMASQGAAELLAAHVTGGELPPYAAAFAPDRYDDPAYRAMLAEWDADAGQL